MNLGHLSQIGLLPATAAPCPATASSREPARPAEAAVAGPAPRKGKPKTAATKPGTGKPDAAETACLADLVDIDANFLHEDMVAEVSYHITQAQLVGVARFVTPVVVLDDCPTGLQLARAHPGQIYVTAGVHPFWTSALVNGEPRECAVDFSEDALAKLRGFAQDPEVRCVGECGLDFCRGPAEKNGFPAPEAQLPWCEAQVQLACELQKPLFLHVRDAFEPFMGILERHRDRLPPAVMHAFTGDEQELQAYRRLDFFVGVTGFICQKSQPLRQFLPKHVPLSRLMVETDAPYMGFKGCRAGEPDGKKDKYPNVPAALPKVVEAVAECYGVTPAEVARQTSENARNFFKMT